MQTKEDSMFNKKKQPPIRSLVADSSQITGDIVFADGLRIDGKLTGNVRAQPDQPSILVVSESASVTGELVADHIIINGRVQGPVRARQMLELQPKAHIVGDVHYAALEMHQGAMIKGQLCPILDDDEKPTLKLEANNP